VRTPLNSILVLGQQLSDNPDGNLTPKQVEFSRTIHGAGTDLLNLSPTFLICRRSNPGPSRSRRRKSILQVCWTWWNVRSGMKRRNRRLSFEVETDPHLTRSIVTDSKRLQQVLKNLLSNAFKFTELGSVRPVGVSS